MLGSERGDFLAIVVVELNVEANCLEIDTKGFVRVVAEVDLDGEDAAVER